MVRRLILFLLPALSACSQSADSFVVHDPAGKAQSAVVAVCRARAPLVRVGNRFTGVVPISCEGAGKVAVSLKDGRQLDCPVGYVTNLSQSWVFRLENGRCVRQPHD